MEFREQVEQIFKSGLNCSQTVLSYFSEKYGLSKEDAVRIGCGFGGGARAGELCGAVAGAVMVIGLKYGNQTASDSTKKSECYQKTVEFHQRFKEKNGSIVCRDLLGCDLTTEEGKKKAVEEHLFDTVCVDMICSSIQILEEMGY